VDLALKNARSTALLDALGPRHDKARLEPLQGYCPGRLTFWKADDAAPRCRAIPFRVPSSSTPGRAPSRTDLESTSAGRSEFEPGARRPNV